MSGFKVMVTDGWKAIHQGAVMGLMAMEGLMNPRLCPDLESAKKDLLSELRQRLDGKKDIRAWPVIEAYTTYYKRFKKTYHLRLQLESVIVKGKPLPRVAALVEAVFMAELKNGLLTAIHDLDRTTGPISILSSQGGEVYRGLTGKEVVLKPGDMYSADAEGPICSVIYGPDRRTAVGDQTVRALFVVYGVPGIKAGQVEDHLKNMENNARLVSPEAELVFREVVES